MTEGDGKANASMPVSETCVAGSHIAVGLILGEGGNGLPPALQVDGGRTESKTGGAQYLESGGRRSTPSTISDDAEENCASQGDVEKKVSRASGTGKKRSAAKASELDGQEGSEDGLDVKRKPRKSARAL